jgi:hypothetical protein
MKIIPIDLLRWPVVLVEWPEEVTLAEMESYFVRLAKVCERGRFALIVDADKGNPMRFTAAHRKRNRELALEYNALFSRTLICEAFVMKAQVVRGVMTALHWFVPTDWPKTFTSSREEAFAWVEPHIAPSARSASPRA